MEVKDIVKEAVTIKQESTFQEALQSMIDGQTNTLLVVDDSGVLVGEVSVADLLDAVVPEYLDGDSIAAHFATEEMFEEAIGDTRATQVQFFMSRDFNAVEMSDGLMAVAANAIGFQRARIPVVDDEGKPVGIISRQGLKHILANYLKKTDTDSV